jgi:hypothetical protein
MRSALLLALVACGHGQHASGDLDEGQRFDCKARSVSYMATHTMGASERGVLMDCAEKGPRILRWRTDASGTRREDSRSVSPGEFEEVWNQVAGTGWENLKDCTNGSNGKQDPVYTFDVKDDQNTTSFSCTTKQVPRPYSSIVDPLDVMAQKGKSQLGDDEPSEMKAMDAKKKQP